MRGITIRFSDDAHKLLKEEAARQGIGLTAYIREAALARAMITRTRRGHYSQTEQLNQAVRTYLAAEEELT